MSFIDAIKFLWNWVVPIPGGDPRRDYYWRMRIAALYGVLTVALTTHILLACGLLTIPGYFTGFAQASEVTGVQEELASMREEDLQKQIIDYSGQQCLLASNQPAWQAIDTLIAERVTEYRKLANKLPVILKACPGQ